MPIFHYMLVTRVVMGFTPQIQREIHTGSISATEIQGSILKAGKCFLIVAFIIKVFITYLFSVF